MLISLMPTKYKFYAGLNILKYRDKRPALIEVTALIIQVAMIRFLRISFLFRIILLYTMNDDKRLFSCWV